jgi:hypothetical protein
MGADDASSAEMRRRHANRGRDRHGLDEDTVERLLAGDLPADQAPPGYGEVAAVLAAMAAPPTADELAGEEAALAELRRLRRARPAAGRPVGRPRRRRVGLAAVVVVGALAAGGGAAAATGHLPAPVRDAARTILGTAGDGEPAPPSGPGGPAASATSGADGTGTSAQGSGPTGTARTPAASGPGSAASPNLQGLCRAYLAGKGGEQGKRLDATALEALARAAGGSDKVPAYCQRVVEAASEPPGDGPGQQPDDKPKGVPPATTGQGNPGQGNPPATTGQGNPSQGSAAARPHGR